MWYYLPLELTRNRDLGPGVEISLTRLQSFTRLAGPEILKLVKTLIDPLLLNQLLVCAHLADLPFVQHHNPVHVSNR